MTSLRQNFLGSIRGRAASLLCVATIGMSAGAARAEDEKQVKAAFVVNFIQFVEWPEGSFQKGDDPIIIAVADPNSLGEALAAVEGKIVRGHKVVIQAVNPKSPGRCHVLIAGGLQGATLQEMLKALGTWPCLTIGDSEHFTEAGGIIRFFLEDRKERFEINLPAAQRVNLVISSKLLKLAKVINK